MERYEHTKKCKGNDSQAERYGPIKYAHESVKSFFFFPAEAFRVNLEKEFAGNWELEFVKDLIV